MQFLDGEPVSCLGCLERQQPEEFYDGVFEGIGGYASSALVSPNSLEDAIIEFFRLLPFEAAKAAYRLAIQELHPDRGGDPVKAARLNAAWQRIESEIFKR